MKKVIKIIGNLLMIAAVVFIVKKFIGMDIDYSQFKSAGVLGALGISFAVQTVVIVMGTYPWLVFTKSLSGTQIPFSAAMPVYTQSNIYKYVPGNVFQYVGRNKLAADMNISHVDVACATIFDVLFCVLWTAIISVALLGCKIAELMGKYGRNLLIVATVGVVLLIALILVVKLKFADKVKSYLSRYAKAFAPENRGQLVKGIMYYLVQNIVSAATYFVCLRLILGGGASFAELSAFTGAFMFAWIIGFVTPGAPGGIGIREGVMLFVSGNSYGDRIMLFVLVLRIGSILADVAAFIIGRIYSSAHKKQI